MNRKAKIIFTIVGILMAFGIVVLLIEYKEYTKEKRYEEIRKDIYEFSERYLDIISPNCTDGVGTIITEEDLVVNGGMDKDTLLDVDKKSYCKTTVNAKCSNKEWKIKVYLSCEDYQDEGYVNW